ncbi:MAG: hypothetical protein A4E65_02298 [Syntrophorhabdus sp. PtaU1.Bin153]|nr:MAG: hypothetical protein A4E65_02298 [Syntrophorhabdus sp. PtaU1.Bin153]
MNPTKQFISDLAALIGKYEDETGVHLQTIKLERIEASRMDDPREDIIERIRLVMS